MPSKKEREEAEALESLRQFAGAGLPAPGALPGRIHGRYATATAGSLTLHLFEWSVTMETDYFDATAHGEYWKVNVPGDQSWTARARGYFVSGTQYFTVGSISGDPPSLTFTGYRDLATNAIWTGVCYPRRVDFSAPMAMVVQEIELVGTGAPSVGPST